MRITAKPTRYRAFPLGLMACAAFVVLAGPAPAAVTGFDLPPSPGETPEPQGPVVEGIAAPQSAQSPAPSPSPTPTPSSASESSQRTRAASGQSPQSEGALPFGLNPVLMNPSREGEEDFLLDPSMNESFELDLSGPEAVLIRPRSIGPESSQQQASRPPANAQPAPSARTVRPRPTPAGSQASEPPDTAAATLPAQAAQLPTAATLPQISPPTATIPGAPAQLREGLPVWLFWLVGSAALLALLAAGAWFWLRRGEVAEFLAPVVVRPKIDPDAPPAGKPRAKLPFGLAEPPAPTFGKGASTPEEELSDDALPAEDGPLSFALEARQLAISLAAATLTYRLTLTNSSKTALHGIAITGDMISAHASASQDEQLTPDGSALSPCHKIDYLAAGKSAQVIGELRLPLTMIKPIRRGDLALFVPLARLRIEAAENGNGAIVKTALIGQRSPRPTAGLQPFRLDLGPRVYREVTQKIFS